MNDRFRNLMKAHDHIVKGRSKQLDNCSSHIGVMYLYHLMH